MAALAGSRAGILIKRIKQIVLNLVSKILNNEFMIIISTVCGDEKRETFSSLFRYVVRC